MKGTCVGKNGIRILPLLVSGIVLISSCTKISEFTVGDNFIESQTRLQVIDTFRVDMSTIRYDSITTQGMNVAYIGSYSDNVFGSIKCESYFDLAYESFSDIEDKAVYDSAAFILEYTNNNFGDTAALMSVAVHRLTEKIVPYDYQFIFNTTSFDYETQEMGSVSFYPTPHSTVDTAVFIPVNEFGEELFNKIRDKDENVTSEEWFKDYIKGFILTSGSSENKALIGFDAHSDHLVLKIFYHIRKQDPEKKEITIKRGEDSHQFNHVDYDPSNSLLQNIKVKGNKISSKETENQVFMQGMIGILPKFRFPSLQDILANHRWKILRAELLIEPVKYSNELFSFPDSLYIFETDKFNKRIALRDSENQPLMATFEYDKKLGDSRYTYDISSYLIKEISDAYVDYEHGLIIGPNQEKLEGSFERLLIEGKNPPVKLRIYYLTY